MISLKTTTGIYRSGNQSNNKNLSSYRQIQWLNIDFDNLFLLPKCAFDSHRKVFLRRDLARYNFNINIVADTPKGNVWICKYSLLTRFISSLSLCLFSFREIVASWVGTFLML